MAMEDDKTQLGGRPSFQPTPSQRQMVEAMAGCGIPETDIATVVGIAAKTLRKYFRAELDTGHIKANAKVAGNLYRIATGSGPRGGDCRDLLAEGKSRVVRSGCGQAISSGPKGGAAARCRNG